MTTLPLDEVMRTGRVRPGAAIGATARERVGAAGMTVADEVTALLAGCETALAYPRNRPWCPASTPAASEDDEYIGVISSGARIISLCGFTPSVPLEEPKELGPSPVPYDGELVGSPFPGV
jgi:hypothetical protein